MSNPPVWTFGHHPHTLRGAGVRVLSEAAERLCRERLEAAILGRQLAARHLADEGVQFTGVPIIPDPALETFAQCGQAALADFIRGE
jgi:hypothetical protein